VILVDTGILSLAFRRQRRDLLPPELSLVYALERLFTLGMVSIIGPIRQEILSGIASQKQFLLLKSRLESIEDLPLNTDAFVLAAEFFNRCRNRGIAPGDIDMMICAAAHIHGCDIFTADPDFAHYAQLLPIRCLRP
jgi:predicted nucleic acid-binding protein